MRAWIGKLNPRTPRINEHAYALLRSSPRPSRTNCWIETPAANGFGSPPGTSGSLPLWKRRSGCRELGVAIMAAVKHANGLNMSRVVTSDMMSDRLPSQSGGVFHLSRPPRGRVPPRRPASGRHRPLRLDEVLKYQRHMQVQ